MDSRSFIQITVSLFLVMNAAGQIPLFIAILARYERAKQKKIIIRELFFALGILMLFTFFGDDVLRVLGITRSIIGIVGGVLLFLVALGMIFPKPKTLDELPPQEPLVVPLAIPVIAGPGTITAVMVFSHEVGTSLFVATALLCAWIPSVAILLVSPFIKRFLGDKGLQAVERFGGMIVCLIGIQMLSSGIISLIKTNFAVLL